jgi:Cft2 family RNA processing exonuclease
MVLYDCALNNIMEGKAVQSFSLDDVDRCFERVVPVKYNQTISVAKAMGISEAKSDARSHVKVRAYPSGRTIGGSIWRIQYFHADILYAVDISLVKDTIIDGAPLDTLPVSPSLLILESQSPLFKNEKKQAIKKREREESLIFDIMNTVRNEGNVLIPCETAGRALELLKVLGTHWAHERIGLYKLVFLSPMAKNVFDFVQSQLEWMSASLSHEFYMGQPNPFELPYVNSACSISDIIALGSTPKVVIATGPSLDNGLSKELLLLWGGDPRCKVIFTDPLVASDSSTLTGKIISQIDSPPIVVDVNKPKQVKLSGNELVQYIQKVEANRKEAENLRTSKQEQEELLLLRGRMLEEEDEGRGDGEEGSNTKRQRTSDLAKGYDMGVISTLLHSDDKANHNLTRPSVLVSNHTAKKSRGFIQGSIPDEYGAGIEDLDFSYLQGNDPHDNTGNDDAHQKSNSNPSEAMKSNSKQSGNSLHVDRSGFSFAASALTPHDVSRRGSTVPTKIVSEESRVRLTCNFVSNYQGGRADLKAHRAMISKVSPRRLLVLRSPFENRKLEPLLKVSKSLGIEEEYVHVPKGLETIDFSVTAETVLVQLPLSFLSTSLKSIKGSGFSGIDTNSYSIAGLGDVHGMSLVEANRASNGSRVLKLKICTTGETNTSEVGIEAGIKGEDEDVEIVSDEEHGEYHESDDEYEMNELVTNEVAASVEAKMLLSSSKIGGVSAGEIQLKSLQQLLEDVKVPTEYKVGREGGILRCGNTGPSTTTIRKENQNDFVVEGPPSYAFYESRSALYKKFAFL